MAAVEPTVLKGARWSEATRCPRMSFYSHAGVIGDGYDDVTLGLFERGQDMEDIWGRRLAERYTGPIIRQHEIPWGDGYHAHVDFLLPDDDRAHIEVKSTTTPLELPGIDINVSGVETTSAVLQVVGGAAFDPEGGTAEVVAFSPVNYRERRYPVTLTDDLVGAARELADVVTHAIRTDTPPARCCQTPDDARGRMCQYAAHCFADWTPDDPIQLHGEVVGLAETLLDATGQVKVAEKRVKELKAERDDARAALRGYLGTPKHWYDLEGVRVRVRPQSGRTTFGIKDALAAGTLTEEQAAPYVKTGQPFDLWDVEVSDDAGAEG